MLDRNAKIFFFCVLIPGAAVVVSTAAIRLPGNDQGYEPTQPIAFSHRLHAGELAIHCLYCHDAAEKGPSAGIPATSVCMNCHVVVTTSKNAADTEKLAAVAEKREPRRIVSPEIGKIYRALGLDDDQKPIAGAESRPLAWERVHRLPDHVAFDHRAHITRGVECQQCHGAVETMDRVRQDSNLSMGWCVECHRINAKAGRGALTPAPDHTRVASHVTTDCSACHY